MGHAVVMAIIARDVAGETFVFWVMGVDQSDQQVVYVPTLPVLSTNYYGCVKPWHVSGWIEKMGGMLFSLMRTICKHRVKTLAKSILARDICHLETQSYY